MREQAESPSPYVVFEDFARELPGLNRRQFQALRDAPKSVRLTPKSRPLYRRDEILTWISRRFAPFNGN